MKAALLVSLLLLPGCGALSKLSEVGRPPAMTPSGDPTADPAYRPISLPMPRGRTEPAEANSLWRAGSRAFFKDQRAAAVGDIVTVLVNITDQANLANASTGGRTGTENARPIRTCSASRNRFRKDHRPQLDRLYQQQRQRHRYRLDQAGRKSSPCV